MQNKKSKSSVVQRHIIAALFLPLFIAYIYYLPPVPYFIALLMIAGVTALWEFYAMYRVPVRLSVPGVISGGVLLYVACIYPSFILEGIFVNFFILMVIRLYAEKSPSGSMTEIGPLAAGLFYVVIFVSFQWLLRSEEYGREYIFMLYTCVWLADGGAFYIGTYLGKHKLYPAISPNKTWEGAYGSLIGGAIGAVVIRTVFDMPISLAAAAAIGVVMGVTALVGDLVESMFKRDAGVKDSGVFIPGHGGMLDKLDGMLAAGPVLYIIVRYT